MQVSTVVAKARSGTAAACSQSSSNIVRLRGACICYLEPNRRHHADNNNPADAASTCGWPRPTDERIPTQETSVTLQVKEAAHHVALITIDNQPKRNALTRAAMGELAEVWERLGEAEDCRCIVITGA